jgi:hypothetical protein
VTDQQIEPHMRSLDRDAYRIHKLLGSKVKSFRLNPPLSFALDFDSGLTLEVFDRSREYESFSIQPGNWFI